MTYNELMQKAGKRISPKFYYYTNNNKVEILQDNIQYARPSFKTSLLGTVMIGLKAELNVELPNEAIYFENTVRYGTDSATKTIGPFYLKETPEYNADNKTYTHILYDNFLKAMVDYKPIEIVYPCTVLNFFKKLCMACGFTTNITSLPNGERILNYDIYDGIGFTFRDVFEDIGYATASLFRVNGLNVEKCSLGTDNVTINDDILKNENISIGAHIGPINSIVLSRSADTDSIYKRDESLTQWNEFKISDNQLMNDNNRSDYLDELYNALYGIEYDLFDLELVGYGGFEPLQKITINTNSQIARSYVFNNEEEYTQGYRECIFAEQPDETETDYTKADKTDRRINQTYMMVNKQNGVIQSLANKIVDISDTKTGIGSVQLENNFEGELHRLSIKGNISLLYPRDVDVLPGVPLTPRDGLVPSNDLVPSEPMPYIDSILYPSDDLYMTEMTLLIDDTKYELDIDFLNYIDNEASDEFVYEDGNCYIIRRVGIDSEGNKFRLPNDVTEPRKSTLLMVAKNSVIKMKSFDNAILRVDYLLENEYTTTFATQVEVSAEIRTVAGEINLKVDSKLDESEYTGAEMLLKINQDESEAKLKADKVNLAGKEINLTSDDINIKSTNFKVDKNGNMIANNGTFNGVINSKEGVVGGWTINSSGFTNGVVKLNSDGSSTIYTVADLIIIRNYILEVTGFNLPSQMIQHYDIDGDGKVTAADYVILQNLIGISMN